MSSIAIFIYGVFVFALVGTALALIVWGIVTDSRSRADSPASPDGGVPATGREP